MVGSVVHCSRCGKASILVKSWVEKLDTRQGTSEIIHEQYQCADKDCQKIVNQTIANRKILADERAQASQLREENRLSHKQPAA